MKEAVAGEACETGNNTTVGVWSKIRLATASRCEDDAGAGLKQQQEPPSEACGMAGALAQQACGAAIFVAVSQHELCSMGRLQQQAAATTVFRNTANEVIAARVVRNRLIGSWQLLRAPTSETRAYFSRK